MFACVSLAYVCVCVCVCVYLIVFLATLRMCKLCIRYVSSSYYTPSMAYGIYCTRPEGAKCLRASAVNMPYAIEGV